MPASSDARPQPARAYARSEVNTTGPRPRADYREVLALGLRSLGVLLMGALIIIPAVSARHLARGLNQMLFIAVACAVIATVVGTALASSLQRQTGPYIVAVAAAGFVLSLLRRTT